MLLHVGRFSIFFEGGGGGGLYQICAILNNYTNACAPFLLKNWTNEIFAQKQDTGQMRAVRSQRV